MLITFKELRKIKHHLPTGSIQKIARKLNMKEQSVRNFFGAKKSPGNLPSGCHKQPGFSGGIVKIENPAILDIALQMIDGSHKIIKEAH